MRPVKIRSGLREVGLVTLLTTTALLGTLSIAFADGGNGGSGTGDIAGGAGGVGYQGAAGGDGTWGFGLPFSGGGGGAAGGGAGGAGGTCGDECISHGGAGGTGGLHGNGQGSDSLVNLLVMTGQNGGDGYDGRNFDNAASGGGGGGGGYGAVVTSGGTQLNFGIITAGAGGSGGDSDGGSFSYNNYTRGGDGGDGGVGVYFVSPGVTFTNFGSITAGNGGGGGDGGGANTGSGGGGDGAAGVIFAGSGNNVLTNYGTITGGTGGDPGSVGGCCWWNNGTPGAPGAGGDGVVGSGLTVINGGTITAGRWGEGGAAANAITFTGGTNTLQIQTGSVINGNVVASGTSTLQLGGLGSATFDVSQIGGTAQYQGFNAFEKVGSSTWTLTGTAIAPTSWSVFEGVLVLSSMSVLGGSSASLTVNGGTLQFGSALTIDNAINIGPLGAFFSLDYTPVTISSDITGTGELWVFGGSVLTLSGANTYTGNTNVGSETTLALTGTGSLSATGTVDLAAPYLTIAGGVLDISGVTTGGVTVGGLTGGGNVLLGANTLTVDVGSAYSFPGDLFSGIIADHGSSPGEGGGLVKQGVGLFILSGASTYKGSTTISAGTLALFGNGSLDAKSAISIASGAILDISGLSTQGLSVEGLAGSGAVMLGSRTLTLSTTADSLLAVSVADGGRYGGTGGSVVKQGSGTLTLTGTNTFSGGLSVNGGAVQVAADANLGATSGSVALDGGTLAITAGFLSNRSVSLGSAGGTLNVAGGQTFTLGGVLSGVGGLSMTGAGTVALTGTSTYTGATTINAGTLGLYGGSLASPSVTVASGATLTGFGSIAGAISVAGGGTLAGGVTSQNNPAATALMASSLTLATGADSVLMLGGAANTGIAEVSGDLALAGTLNVSGDPLHGAGLYRVFTYGGTLSGSLTLGTTPVDYTSSLDTSQNGQVNLLVQDDSSVQLWMANGSTPGGSGSWTSSSATWYATPPGVAIPWGGQTGIFTGAAGTVTLSGSQSIEKLEFVTSGYVLEADANVADSGLAIHDGSRLWVEGHDVTATITAPISGTGGLEKIGAGTLVLNGANTFTGGLRISGGTIQTGSDGALGAAGGTLTLARGGLAASSSFDTTRRVTLEGFGILSVAAGQTLGVSGSISGTGTLRKEGDGTVTLSGTNSYAGDTEIIAGTLHITGANAIPAASAVKIAAAGTLSLGASNSIGSLQGAGSVALGAFTLTTGGDGSSTTFSGSIGGAGGLVKTGTGTFALTGANSFTGGTTIAEGALVVGDSGTAGSLAGDVVDNGVLAFYRADAVTFAGTISGTGAVMQAGAGTLTLTGANSFSGGMQVNAGSTLQVSADANLGAASGTLALQGGTLSVSAGFTSTRTVGLSGGGTIAVADGQTLTLGGVIGGDGGLTKTGTGTLTVTASNTFTGGVNIAAGTLQIGNGGTTGWINGPIVNNGSLIYNLSGSYAFPSALSGSGTVSLQGGGTAYYEGSTFTGTIPLDGANLVLSKGVSTTSAFVVGANSVLSGSGTIGSLVVNAGGTVSPGYSPGSLVVSGNVAFNSGSTYQADVAPGHMSDLITAGGSATIAADSQVAIVGARGSYANSRTFTLLSAAGGLTGTFSGATSNLAFLDPLLSYSSTSVYVTLVRNDIPFVREAFTRNERAVATGIESLGAGNAIYDAVASQRKGEAYVAFDALSGEAYASVSSVLQQQSIYVRDAVSGRLRQALTAPGVSPLAYGPGPVKAQLAEGYTPTLWAQGYGGWGTSWSNGNAASISNTIGGFLMGADVSVAENARAGLFGGYSRSTFDVDGRSSSGSANNYDLGLYAGAQYGAVALRGGAAYTWHDLSMSRSVVFPGFAESLKGSDTTGTAQVFGEIGYDLDVGAIAFEPFLGLAYVNVSGASLGEEGGAAALSVSTDDMSTVYSTLGVRLATTVEVGGRTLTPYATLGWQHAFGDVTPSSTMQFAGGLTPFTVSGVPVAADALLLEAGLSYALSPTAQIGATYAGQLAGDASQNTFTAQFSLKF
ncbi:autotransporter domain-containing protein [Ancylobacter sp.]|uniref:autotransporter domain-containing protein n=1 Tax=Ancylobacter sp. TaxID=1872567 RepID=UPI003C7E1EAD